jgi:signal transduction histidine kinase
LDSAPSRRDPSPHWRATTSRLLLGYGVFFVIWGTLLLGSIYWETTRYLAEHTDRDLTHQIDHLRHVDRAHLAAMLDDYIALEDTSYNAWGLFDAQGRWINGDIVRLPPVLKIDGGPIRTEARDIIRQQALPNIAQLHLIAAHLDDDNVLALAHTTGVTAHVGSIIKHALLWGLSFTLVPGLIGGLILNIGPRRRIRQIKVATQAIMHGDLHKRLPVSKRDDEVDRLAAIVNDMLDQIERLMGEVKGVCDNIAHDLRTPLTRLRSQLYRVQQQLREDDPHQALVERCVEDIDDVLGRFRALLRISELEDHHRREGFVAVDLGETLQHVHELYAPLAEGRQQLLELRTEPGLIVQADPDLLFEAIGNLVANAIKFTPDGGTVTMRATRLAPERARIEVSDSGPGIPAQERHAIWQRFYRGEGSRETAGHGLGLSIVAAIAKLHDFELMIDGDEGGARIGMECAVRAPVHA